jgi:hypothetical protein
MERLAVREGTHGSAAIWAFRRVFPAAWLDGSGVN